MAKLADAADLKSAGPKGLWGFDSPSRHQLNSGRSARTAVILKDASPHQALIACTASRIVYLVPSETLADSDKSAGFTDSLVK
jgi:hypothetical protein